MRMAWRKNSGKISLCLTKCDSGLEGILRKVENKNLYKEILIEQNTVRKSTSIMRTKNIYVQEMIKFIYIKC
jgi:hypothetical protein